MLVLIIRIILEHLMSHLATMVVRAILGPAV
jgi:hypothetical protein